MRLSKLSETVTVGNHAAILCRSPVDFTKVHRRDVIPYTLRARDVDVVREHRQGIAFHAGSATTFPSAVSQTIRTKATKTIETNVVAHSQHLVGAHYCVGKTLRHARIILQVRHSHLTIFVKETLNLLSILMDVLL